MGSDGFLEGMASPTPNSNSLAQTEECYRVLTETFGHSGYKGKQKEIINAAVSGADVFVLAPTGMGKSICFQVPAAAAKSGITIVVSPLLALMKNQIASLRRKCISAVSLMSETPLSEKEEILQDLASGSPTNRLFYTTPERLCTRDIMQLLDHVYSAGKLNRLVVDELIVAFSLQAHCISEWGHDFRSEYRKLGQFRDRFPSVPIMALTATATPSVQRDIVQSLRMTSDRLFKAVHPFNRANLFYEVRYRSTQDESTSPSTAQMSDILDFITTLYRRRERPSSGIIYCRSKATCNELSAYLRGKGINSRPYHRGISSTILDRTLREWEVGGAGEGGVDVVCATIAFGMGIDKSDVRYIIHYDLPKSFEGYYQETGRAGRDGSPSRCVLYYSREDALRLQKLVSDSHSKRQCAADAIDGPAPSQRSIDSFSALVNFAESIDVCRHVAICRYFGEATDERTAKEYCDDMCDVCKYPDKTKRRKRNLASEELVAARVSLSLSRQKPTSVSADADASSSNARPIGPSGYGASSRSSSIGIKRRGDGVSSSNTNTASKRSKSEHRMPAALVTKPHSSISSLKKPFRTPFKTPFKVPTIAVDVPESSTAQIDDLADNEGTSSPMPVDSWSTSLEQYVDSAQIDNNIEILDEPDHRPSSPIDIPEMSMDIALDASFSQKIPLSRREECFQSIRHALYKVMGRNRGGDEERLWSHITGSPRDSDARHEILDMVSKSLEYDAHTMSATESGYQGRIRQKLRTLDVIRKQQTWVDRGGGDSEGMEEVLSAFRESCQRWKKNSKGKGKHKAV
ncbi:P-loop containing nucleoside triphosphate hydrolase protein [Hygrophoropsis aurantiaca]|uniref:P-loop containing nucleoside triphosphate hydrolase protein n=1 Tax=Hygrophoropsis aurantiaca TaxID=72124 RepID=A0ACB8AL21_9AGAM|nr:P-loop containing nucleoside triphosphate hydrolase protein [Hygrophoropsis aurantiaca]